MDATSVASAGSFRTGTFRVCFLRSRRFANRRPCRGFNSGTTFPPAATTHLMLRAQLPTSSATRASVGAMPLSQAATISAHSRSGVERLNVPGHRIAYRRTSNLKSLNR